MADQRIAFKIHLCDQPLCEATTEDRKMHMRGAPIIHLVTEGIRAGLYRAEDIAPFTIRQAAPAAAEIRINRTDIAIITVPVAPRSIGLPNLYQDAAQGPRIAIQHAAMDDDSLTNREAHLGVIQDQISVARAKFPGTKGRFRNLSRSAPSRETPYRVAPAPDPPGG